MFTIKIQRQGEGQQIISTDSQVTILREGDHEFTAHSLTLEKEHQKRMERQCPELPYVSPQTILCYGLAIAYLYDGDRAWVMNANGKTVATV
ncbi:hypothetical protein [Halomonas sp. NO4]|uniref:hypothetical protein n=1 Tax=Halomonas sp. NO4 TaxID=2484813 RepID=UPI0013D5A719|nr:hypothetical protein [Halomonas sp. NO4]